uniref:Uncharacterized protein n=1 Tax=Aegilops tauschii subsp. strangulata TaxID=200361 RepID=A0A453SIJ8_AEGTS
AKVCYAFRFSTACAGESADTRSPRRPVRPEASRLSSSGPAPVAHYQSAGSTAPSSFNFTLDRRRGTELKPPSTNRVAAQPARYISSRPATTTFQRTKKLAYSVFSDS